MFSCLVRLFQLLTSFLYRIYCSQVSCGQISPCLFHKSESFCCPYMHWQCGDYQQAFQSGHLNQTHTTMNILLTPRAEGQFIPLMTFTSFSYVCLSFLRLRWPDETSSRILFSPDYCCHYCIFPTGICYILLSHWHCPLRCVWQG